MKLALKAYRRSINPPYSKKDLPAIFGTLAVLLLALPLTLFSLSKQQHITQEAKVVKEVYGTRQYGNKTFKDEDIIRYYTYPTLTPGQVSNETVSKQLQQQHLFANSTVTNKPNIIFIITDDQSPKALGIAGNRVVRTPNIDALGKSGMYFANMYLPIGQCAPSRSTLWTGKLPHNHGVVKNGLLLPLNQLTLPQILKANNYHLGFVGKCHLGDLKNFGFDSSVDSTGIADWYNYDVLRNGVREHHTEYETDFLTNEAMLYLNSRKANPQQPFMLWFATDAPHVPTTPPRGSNRYSLSQIALPPSATDNLSTKPIQQSLSDAHRLYTVLGPDGIRAKLKDSYEVISNLDDNVGKLLQTVDSLGLRNNTIIIFMSDNGQFYGEHQLYQKGGFFYEEVIKTPFMISYPPLIRSNQINRNLAYSVDIMPTLLDMVGVSAPAEIQGKSFKQVLASGPQTYRNSIYMEYTEQSVGPTPMRGIVMDGYKWVHYLPNAILRGVTYPDGSYQELYDLTADPYEVNNLMQKTGPEDHPLERLLVTPQYGQIVKKLRRELAIWETDTNGPSRFVLTDGRVTSPSPTTLVVTWKNAKGLPTSEVEFKEKNCSTCQAQEVNDFSHTTANHSVTLSNLKPNTTYTIRAFSIGIDGVGGYLNLEGTTGASVQVPPDSPTTSGCTSNTQCPPGQVCQQACTSSYPPICRGVCTAPENSSITPSGSTSSGGTTSAGSMSY